MQQALLRSKSILYLQNNKQIYFKTIVNNKSFINQFYNYSYYSTTCSILTREQRVDQLLRKELNPTYLKVIDLSGGCDGGTLRIEIESEMFIGKSKVTQHRMVQNLIKEEMKTLHALSLETAQPPQ
eukprot:TRINITY_DN8995_c0_g1_i1.p1 TRINITY_DN8995_c0_g1~~TRINITY_DN8995_c0_g1_i1.p1  ORF type:complete len:126 (-),score=66.81 TRINITY_DN8995_c0_g1_i1:98-475(-)